MRIDEIRRLVAFSGGVSSPPEGLFLGWLSGTSCRQNPGSPYLDPESCQVASAIPPALPGAYPRLCLQRCGARNTHDRSRRSRGGCCVCDTSSCRCHILVA